LVTHIDHHGVVVLILYRLGRLELRLLPTIRVRLPEVLLRLVLYWWRLELRLLLDRCGRLELRLLSSV
jgi:hypothetical protein